jgi:hypothetical protein
MGFVFVWARGANPLALRDRARFSPWFLVVSGVNTPPRGSVGWLRLFTEQHIWYPLPRMHNLGTDRVWAVVMHGLATAWDLRPRAQHIRFEYFHAAVASQSVSHTSERPLNTGNAFLAHPAAP